MADFVPNVLDLALYFCDDNGQVAPCWVSQGVYTDVPCVLDPVWQMADLFEQSLAGGDVFYVVNLSKLLGPGKGPIPKAPLAAAGGSIAVPGPKDLVVIPPDDPNAAYVVKRAVYSNPNVCPPIGEHPDSADLDFMALNEGAVLANLPKASSPSGWTCYLLSLVSLKSGAVPGLDNTNKAAYIGQLTGKLKR